LWTRLWRPLLAYGDWVGGGQDLGALGLKPLTGILIVAGRRMRRENPTGGMRRRGRGPWSKQGITHFKRRVGKPAKIKWGKASARSSGSMSDRAGNFPTRHRASQYS
ncbi:MAG: hypothetical protein VYB59_15250, partial [Pseudomonadota bacterium]|nr:hypothetical protein [Pseudomonadota bacterium]